jgi:hypothetical protein
MKRRLGTVLYRVLGSVVVIFAVVWGVVGALEGGDNHQFDAAQWGAAATPTKCDNSNRYRMLGDLQEHHLKVGMRALPVLELLGMPGHVTAGRVKGSPAAKFKWEYPTRQNTLRECYVLNVSFERGRVAATYVSQVGWIASRPN